jgi:hypothetical protein
MIKHLISAVFVMTLAVGAASAAPPEGKGGGKGGGGNNPPVEPFVPAIAYLQDGRKTRDLRLANRAGDQACLVLQTNTGSPKLRSFVFDAANKRLAYSLSEEGVYLTNWIDDPCEVGQPIEIRQLEAGDHPEFMDFSPQGGFVAWTEPDPNIEDAYTIVMHEIGGGNTTLALTGWRVGGLRFSPDFESSGELLFTGSAIDLSLGWGAYNSIFAYSTQTQAIRKVLDGASFYLDPFLTVTNPQAVGPAKVAFTDLDTKDLLQVRLSDGQVVETFPGYEAAYSCDNTELIHRGRGKGTKLFVYLTKADGSSSEFWSKSELRWFDWFCP